MLIDYQSNIINKYQALPTVGIGSYITDPDIASQVVSYLCKDQGKNLFTKDCRAFNKIFFDPALGSGLLLSTLAYKLYKYCFELACSNNCLFTFNLSCFVGCDVDRACVDLALNSFKVFTSQIQDGVGIKVVGDPKFEVRNATAGDWYTMWKITSQVTAKNLIIVSEPPTANVENLQSNAHESAMVSYDNWKGYHMYEEEKWTTMPDGKRKKIKTKHHAYHSNYHCGGSTLDAMFTNFCFNDQQSYADFYFLVNRATVTYFNNKPESKNKYKKPKRLYRINEFTTNGFHLAFVRKLRDGEEMVKETKLKHPISNMFACCISCKESEKYHNHDAASADGVVFSTGCLSLLPKGTNYFVPFRLGGDLYQIPDDCHYGAGHVYVLNNPTQETLDCFNSRAFKLWWDRNQNSSQRGKCFSKEKVANTWPLYQGEDFHKYEDLSWSDDDIYDELYSLFIERLDAQK